MIEWRDLMTSRRAEVAAQSTASETMKDGRQQADRSNNPNSAYNAQLPIVDHDRRKTRGMLVMNDQDIVRTPELLYDLELLKLHLACQFYTPIISQR